MTGTLARSNGTPQRIVSGSGAIAAAEQVRKEQERRNEWPYWWSYPPKKAQRVTASGFIVAPTPGTQTLVLAYRVPSGFQFVLRKVVQCYIGGSLSLGDATWNIDKNTPLGAPDTQSVFVQGFYNLQIPLGSVLPMYSEFDLEQPEIFTAQDLIQSKVTVTNNINSGQFVSVFKGWLVDANL